MDTVSPNMPALVWLGPREMELRQVRVPVPEEGEVLVAVSAVGICGSELSGYLGESSIRKPPLVMGHEFAGTVSQANGGSFADGSPARAGVRVTCNPLVVCGECDRCRAGLDNLCRNRTLVGAGRPGGFARFVAVPARQCWPLPEHVDTVAGSLVEPLACGVRAAALAQVPAGGSLLVLGAGPIGLCCLAAARAAGIENILISDVSDSRLDIARAWGANVTINARSEDAVESAKQHVAGGVDATIDAVGTTTTRRQAIEAVVPGGTAVFIGLHEEASPIPANYLVRQEVKVQGSFSYREVDFAQSLAMISGGLVVPRADWLEQRPLAEGKAAFDELIEGKAQRAKIVLDVE